MTSSVRFEKSSVEYIEAINIIYQKYIGDSSYVFKSCDRGKTMAILKKPFDHVNNEVRLSIIDKKFAKHRGTSMYVEVVFDKFNPSRVLTSTKSYFAGLETVYTVGEIISPDSYTNDDSEDSNGIFYCTCVDGAFYYDLHFVNYSGEYYDFYYNGSIKKHGMLLDGFKNGQWKEYYDNGKLMSIEHYLSNKLNGKYLEWFSDGKPSEVGMYSNDKPVGFHISWYENGVKDCEGYYDETGLKHGNWLVWNNNINKNEFITYNHGTQI